MSDDMQGHIGNLETANEGLRLEVKSLSDQLDDMNKKWLSACVALKLISKAVTDRERVHSSAIEAYKLANQIMEANLDTIRGELKAVQADRQDWRRN